MPRWIKEILIGIVPVTIIFLVFIGVNIIPLLVAGVMFSGLLMLMHARGGLAVGAGQERKRKKMARTS